MELPEILHQSSAWGVFDKRRPKWGRPSCPLRASSGKPLYRPQSRYGTWLTSPPFPCKQQLRFFSAPCPVSFWKATAKGAKVHMQILPQAADSRKVPPHTLLKGSFMTKQILRSGGSYASHLTACVALHHCLQREIQQTKEKREKICFLHIWVTNHKGPWFKYNLLYKEAGSNSLSSSYTTPDAPVTRKGLFWQKVAPWMLLSFLP